MREKAWARKVRPQAQNTVPLFSKEFHSPYWARTRAHYLDISLQEFGRFFFFERVRPGVGQGCGGNTWGNPAPQHHSAKCQHNIISPTLKTPALQRTGSAAARLRRSARNCTPAQQSDTSTPKPQTSPNICGWKTRRNAWHTSQTPSTTILQDDRGWLKGARATGSDIIS